MAEQSEGRRKRGPKGQGGRAESLEGAERLNDSEGGEWRGLGTGQSEEER